MRLYTLITAAALTAAVAASGCDDTTGSDTSDADGGDVPDIATPDVGDATELTDLDTALPDAGGDADIGVDGDAGAGDSDGGDAGEDANADTQPNCRSDGMCPGNAVCDMDEGNCRIYSVVQIRDVTQTNSSDAQTACGESASGSDLFELELQGAFGTPRGYGRAVAANLTASENTKASTVLDGTSNSLKRTQSGDLCPSAGFGSDSVLSLGCDGSLLVVFTDGAGNVQGLSSGQQLVVHEYGQQCCEGGCPKEYWEVRVCKAQSPQQFQNQMPDSNGNWPTCNTQILQVGAGRGTATIRLPRP